MLKGIDQAWTAALLPAPAAAGHGDRVAVGEAGFPAARTASRRVALPGVGARRRPDGIQPLLPADTAAATLVMQAVSVVRTRERRCDGSGLVTEDGMPP